MYWWGLNDHKTEVPNIVMPESEFFDLSKKSKFTEIPTGCPMWNLLDFGRLEIEYNELLLLETSFEFPTNRSNMNVA